MFRVSLRHLFVLVTFIALAIVSLKYASPIWEATVLGLALIVFFVALIVALVDRGPRQAFAIGMAAVMFGYAGLKFAETPPTPLHLGIPTSALLVYPYMYYPEAFPPAEHFFPTAAFWWALLVGYLGGHFARFVYHRRTKENASQATE